MTEVVRQRDRLHQVLVQAHRARHGSAELSNLQRMRETGSEEVAFVVQEDLGLVDQAAERRAVDDAVAIALEIGARGRSGFAATPSAGVRGIGCIRRTLGEEAGDHGSVPAQITGRIGRIASRIGAGPVKLGPSTTR
jgi:hypothetical protein